MCGVAGFWVRDVSEDAGRAALDAMAAPLEHRGPDDEGRWLDVAAGVGLAHRRLSIVDLSPHGRQPMESASGRYVIVYNGEVYNFEELRRELEGVAWRGHSDTEVLLAAIEAWGVERAVRRCIGMFAFGLWDRSERTLTLARDRLGIKPLYVGFDARGVYFGSELRAVTAFPGFSASIDPVALATYLRYCYVPAPQSIHREVRKLEPGTMLVVREPRESAASELRYWSALEVAERGVRDPFSGSIEEATDETEALLRDAVRCRMIADVPLGAFLSGGIDSSTVVALMQSQSSRPVKTFSIGNVGADYDESVHARAVARHLGTDHTELTITAEDALAVVPRLASLYDEPFADSSQLPTYLVSRLARRDVTVALSGDGGDEVFGGYNRHVWAPRVWQGARLIPGGVRRGLARAMTALSPDVWDAIAGRLAIPLRLPGQKMHKLAGVLGVASDEELYAKLTAMWAHPEAVVGHRDGDRRVYWSRAVPTFRERIMLADLVTCLPDDILTKVDRASMAVSLEARVPLIDHRVVELAWRMPLAFKVRRGVGKYLLRRVLHRHVPRAMVERPKMGFGVPVGVWLRGPLREWAEALLAPAALREAMLDGSEVRRTWSEHLSGRRSFEPQLWAVLMYMAWRADRSRSVGARAAYARAELA